MGHKHSRWLTGLAICFLAFFNLTVNSQERGVGVRLRYQQNGQDKEIKLYEASYALLIGMSAYQNWTPLNGPKTDV